MDLQSDADPGISNSNPSSTLFDQGSLSKYSSYYDTLITHQFNCNPVIIIITKTCLHNFNLQKSHFYIVKLGFTGVYIIFFLFLIKNIDCGYSLEPPRRVPTIYDLSRNMENIRLFVFFLSEKFQFLAVKFSIYLYRRVFVMTTGPDKSILQLPWQVNFWTVWQVKIYRFSLILPHFSLLIYRSPSVHFNLSLRNTTK